MRRREFLGVWPVALKAQSTERVCVVSILSILGPDDPEAGGTNHSFRARVVGHDLKIEPAISTGRRFG